MLMTPILMATVTATKGQEKRRRFRYGIIYVKLQFHVTNAILVSLPIPL
jgi:hypothetical protein